MSKQLLVGFLFLLLSGCTVGPDYERPVVISPAVWTISYDAAADLTDSAWWQQFNDPIFDKLIAEALTNNLNLQAAVARVDQFLGQFRTTRSEYFPQINASADVARQDDTDTGLTLPGGPYNSYQGALIASWELDLWGRVRRMNEAARAELLASEAGRRSVLLTLVSNVASNYIVLRGLDRQLEIAWETEQSYAEALRIFRLRHKYGTVSNVEVSQYADIITTSLTKWISGKGDVMAGQVTICPESPLHSDLSAFFAEDCPGGSRLFALDAAVLFGNIVGFRERMAVSNRNGEALAELLIDHPAVDQVYYPKFTTPEYYDAIKRDWSLGGGYGGLMSFVLKNRKKSPKFFDSLKMSKGPSLGTDFSLVCPFTLLAHYDELAWAEGCGLDRHLIRISVGMEEELPLVDTLAEALDGV